MNNYEITMMLDKNELIKFIDTGLASKASIKVVDEGPMVDLATSAPTPATRMRGRPRGPRGSKVNDTILAAMQEGPRPVKELKEALENAGFAAGSLSTSLANLQKAGAVTRVGEGVYGLPQAAQ